MSSKSDCSAPIAKSQKKLIKALHCLFNQYVHCHVPATKIFFADPSSDNYTKMANELNGLLLAMTSSVLLPQLSTISVNANVRLVAYDAAGLLAYDTAGSANTYVNYVTTSAAGNAVSGFNYGVLKGTQVLNTNECVESTYQVKPALSSFGLTLNELPLVITEAGMYERTGCQGVSNTGFIRLTIEVDINIYTFNPCQCNKECGNLC